MVKWIQRGSGFHKKWICDNCGCETTKADWITGQKWKDYIEYFARAEWYRRRDLKRDMDLKNYERDKL